MKRVRIRPTPGFTLIEVLVVVAIIALLISILIPTLKKAKDQARRAVCAAHMHQVMFSVFTYSNDHKGNGPMRGWKSYTIAEPMREAFGWKKDPEPHVLINLGMLWKKWVGNEVDVLYCPSMVDVTRDRPKDLAAGGWEYRKLLANQCYWIFGGYNYGTVLDSRGDSDEEYWGKCPNFRGTNPYPPEVWSSGFVDWIEDVWQVRNPGVQFKMPANSCLISDLWIGGFEPRHSEGKSVNVAYTDGHVRNHRIDKLSSSGSTEQYEKWWYFSMKQ